MRPFVRAWGTRAAIVVFALFAAGCGSSPAPGLHVLAAPPEQAASARFAESVGVGPVSVPEYLDRLQLVSRDASGSLLVSDTQRWAEPLPEGLGRVLAGNLSKLLGTERAVTFPWSRARAPDLQVPVEVQRFEPGPDGTVHFEARWSVKRADGTVLLAARSSRFDVSSGAGTEARVHAYGEAAARLAREIAAGLRACE